jgi:IS30 family transposase
MGFRVQGCKRVPGSAREVFLEALGSGRSVAAAATVAGVSHRTGKGGPRPRAISPRPSIGACGIRRPCARRSGRRCARVPR